MGSDPICFTVVAGTSRWKGAVQAGRVRLALKPAIFSLNRLDGKVAIFPMDPLPAEGSAVVEIYTRIYIRNAGLSGKKIRTNAELNVALAALGSPTVKLRKTPTDHQTDALVTAAGMLAHLADPRAFDPPGLTPAIARTEGWTFGII